MKSTVRRSKPWPMYSKLSTPVGQMECDEQRDETWIGMSLIEANNCHEVCRSQQGTIG